MCKQVNSILQEGVWQRNYVFFSPSIWSTSSQARPGAKNCTNRLHSNGWTLHHIPGHKGTSKRKNAIPGILRNCGQSLPTSGPKVNQGVMNSRNRSHRPNMRQGKSRNRQTIRVEDAPSPIQFNITSNSATYGKITNHLDGGTFLGVLGSKWVMNHYDQEAFEGIVSWIWQTIIITCFFFRGVAGIWQTIICFFLRKLFLLLN